MIELKFAHREISPRFDGIMHSHRKKPETMTHIPFPIALMGSECASSKGTRSKGKAQMVTLPDHIDNSLSINTGSFCMLLGSFRYLRTPRTQPAKLFTKWLSRRGGKWTFISCFLLYAHHLLSHLIRSVLHDLRLVRIPSHSVKTIHKTVYETAKSLWR